jgi:leucyl/phenylalanyl-tRNA---protein transferase
VGDSGQASDSEKGEAGSGERTAWISRPQPVGATGWAFPPPSLWPDDDLIAIGGDLAPATLITAYRRGIFPMIVEAPEPVLAWWSPNPRGILPLEHLRVPRSLRQSAKRYEVRMDTCFPDVIRACANPARERGWITPAFIEAYTTLHQLGWAHSVEVFDAQGELAGGLYGVRINRFFAGESMFHAKRDASKVALMALVGRMREAGMVLLDVQWNSTHLASLGAVEVPRAQYLDLLTDAIE